MSFVCLRTLTKIETILNKQSNETIAGIWIWRSRKKASSLSSTSSKASLNIAYWPNRKFIDKMCLKQTLAPTKQNKISIQMNETCAILILIECICFLRRSTNFGWLFFHYCYIVVLFQLICWNDFKQCGRLHVIFEQNQLSGKTQIKERI